MDTASLEQLADLIRTYFHRSEGRGKHCLVESCRRGELDYFFAYPEEYSQQQIEWVKGRFDQRPHNPTFEVSDETRQRVAQEWAHGTSQHRGRLRPLTRPIHPRQGSG